MKEENKSKKNKITTVLAAFLAILLIVGGGTYAYLYSETSEVANTFNTNDVIVSLDETTGSEYNIIPGTSEDKDPTVTVNNTVDAYVFVVVTDETDGLVTYTIEDGWTALEGYENVYYREVSADADEKVFSVLDGDKVYYSATIENSDMITDNGDGTWSLKDGVELTFKALAVQKTPFEDPVLAYQFLTADAVVSTVDDFAAAVAIEGNVVILAEGTYDISDVEIADNVTIIGYGEETILYTENITTISSDGVTMSNLTIKGEYDYAKAVSGLEITGDNFTLSNATVTGGGTATNGSVIHIKVSGSDDQVTTLSNVTVTGEEGGSKSVWVTTLTGTLLIEDSVVDSLYSVANNNVDSTGSVSGGLIVNDSVIRGWTTVYNASPAIFTNCSFEINETSGYSKYAGYNCVSIYTDVTFESCAFGEGFEAYAKSGTNGFSYTWNFNNCTKEGTDVTADNIKELFTVATDADTTNVWNKSTCYVNGTLIEAD